MFLRSTLLLTALLVATSAARAQVTINEFMYFPDSSQNEWVELYNVSSNAVSLDEWTIRDNSTDSAKKQTLFDSIPAGGYLIVARRPELFIAEYGTLSCTVIDVSFQQYNDNGGDAITLQNKAGDTVDYVAYDNAWGKQRGYTLEKTNPLLSSRLQSSWRLSTVPGGTPCQPNSAASVHDRTPSAPPSVHLVDRRLIGVAFDEAARGAREGKLVSSDGRTAMTVDLADKNGEIECSALPAGVYMLVIADRAQSTTTAVPVVLQ